MKGDAKKTIDSLKKINDFPFFTATYCGNYKLDEYKKGAIDSPRAVVPFFEDLFKKIGAPITLSFPHQTPGQVGCSSFYYRTTEGPLLGKNLDWKKDPILLLRTRPDNGYNSLSIVDLNLCDIFGLDDYKYKLLLSPYVPFDGINEKGLAVSMLSVYKDAEYPVKPGRISAGDFNIIRIILDSCGNVDEAVEIMEKYNLMQTSILPLHYIIADKNKSCIVEFTNGKMNINENRKVNYLTNFIKLNNPDYENEKKNCLRYQKIEKTLSEKDPGLNMKSAMDLLNEVAVFQPNFEVPSTIWSVVYNIDLLEIVIKIGKIPKLYSVKLEGK